METFQPLAPFMSTEIKKLPNTLKRHGHNLELMKRKGMIVLYRSLSPNRKDGVFGYILAKIRVRNEQTAPNGDIIPKRECFPSPSEFGSKGEFWMPESLDTVMCRFDLWVAEASK